jgi:hypothetical protein
MVVGAGHCSGGPGLPSHQQREAAQSTGISPEAWQLWEADKARPLSTSRAWVVKFLGYDPNPAPGDRS